MVNLPHTSISSTNKTCKLYIVDDVKTAGVPVGVIAGTALFVLFVIVAGGVWFFRKRKKELQQQLHQLEEDNKEGILMNEDKGIN